MREVISPIDSDRSDLSSDFIQTGVSILEVQFDNRNNGSVISFIEELDEQLDNSRLFLLQSDDGGLKLLENLLVLCCLERALFTCSKYLFFE